MSNTFQILKIVPHRIQTDGNGVTTLVALASCPLRCQYCINKEILQSGRAKPFTPEELVEAVSQDLCYFLATGGGITFGGGEPLLQYKAIKEFRQMLPEWISVNVETSLNVPEEAVEEMLPVISEWIIDIKSLNETIYKKYTEKEPAQAIKNLHTLAEKVPDKCKVRVPIIPGYKEADTAEKERKELEKMGFKNIEVFEYRIKKKKIDAPAGSFCRKRVCAKMQQEAVV